MKGLIIHLYIFCSLCSLHSHTHTHTHNTLSLWPSEKKEEIDDYSKGKMPKCTPKILQLCHFLRQLLDALNAPVRCSRHYGRRGGAPADDAHRTNDLAARRGPPVPPDSCTAEGCILVRSPRHCPSHGWTTRVRVECGGHRHHGR